LLGPYLTADDYMDSDVAYLLGMLFGRGTLFEQGDVRRLVVTLHIRRTLPKLPPDTPVLDMDLELENERSLNGVRRRINNLLDANVDIAPVRRGETALTAVFVKPTIGWRDLKALVCDGHDRADFKLPDSFFQFPRPIKEEFVRGFADVAVTPSWADNERNTYARVAFPVVHANLIFARQLERLLEALGTQPHFLEGSPRTRRGKREHRIRMRADAYEGVGFGFDHKNRLLRILADWNRQRPR